MVSKQGKNELLERLLKFSVKIIVLSSKLPKTPAGYAIANQIVRSGCSVGANCEEAQNSISAKEFLHSINIALKESRETLYWLKVIKLSALIEPVIVNVEINECNEIVSILVTSVKSLKKKISR